VLAADLGDRLLAAQARSDQLSFWRPVNFRYSRRFSLNGPVSILVERPIL
jgi:hypothetical protein